MPDSPPPSPLPEQQARNPLLDVRCDAWEGPPPQPAGPDSGESFPDTAAPPSFGEGHPRLPPLIPQELVEAAKAHRRMQRCNSAVSARGGQPGGLHRTAITPPLRGRRAQTMVCNPKGSLGGGDEAGHPDQSHARIALWAFHLADSRGVDELRPEDVITLVPKAKSLEPFSKHVGAMMLEVPQKSPSGEALPPVFTVSKPAFVRYAVTTPEFMSLLKQRLDIELSPAKKAMHTEWIEQRRLSAVGSTILIQEKPEFRKSAIAPAAQEAMPGGGLQQDNVVAVNVPQAGGRALGGDDNSSRGPTPHGDEAFGIYAATGGPAERDGWRVSKEVAKTFVLLFLPAVCVLAGLVFAAKAVGNGGLCSHTCDCSSDILGRLTKHILVKRLPFDLFLHVYSAHLFSSITRIGESWLNVDLVLPVLASVFGEVVSLYILHILFDGVSNDVELLTALLCAVIPTLSLAVYRSSLRRGLFAVCPVLFVMSMLIVIWGLKGIALDEFSADIVLSAWPIVVFLLTQGWVVLLNLLVGWIHHNGKVTFHTAANESGILPDRQVLHVAVALDVFSDAVRALLVVTITDTVPLLLNLSLTVVIEAVTRNNLHKWILARLISPCTEWTPSPTRLEEFMNASQLYAGYMPFTGLCIMYIAKYFPWAASFVDCATGDIELPGTYLTVVWLFATEVLCSISSLLVHTRLRCILPARLRSTGQLAPLISLKGVVQCSLLSLALSSFVLYGFAGSGDIAMSASLKIAAESPQAIGA